MILCKPLARKKISELPAEKDDKLLSLEFYVNRRDWSGACALLECRHGPGLDTNPNIDVFRWKSYCYLHDGQLDKATEMYEKENEPAEETALHLAVCYFYQGRYEDSLTTVEEVAETSLKSRLLMHCMDRLGKDGNIVEKSLPGSIHDQLSLAALYFRHGRFEDSLGLYKQIQLENENYIALDYYIALCYHKLEFYDVALEHNDAYLRYYPDSICATNLKASTVYKAAGPSQAEKVLQGLFDNSNSLMNGNASITEHNMAVFRQGEDMLKVWQSLKSTLPEALHNLIVWQLHDGNFQEAAKLVECLEGNTPTDCVLKGAVWTCLGQETESLEYLQKGQEYLHMIGSSEIHCDTLLGRQCMATCFMLSQQYGDALVFLESIHEYLDSNQTFLWNYGTCLAEMGNYFEAQTQLEKIQNETYRSDLCFLKWLARCYIANGQSESAWSLYLQHEEHLESCSLLELIANDCYVTGSFLISARAFDRLCRFDPTAAHWDGKHGSILGAFRSVVTQQAPTDFIDELLQMSHPADDQNKWTAMTRAIWNWASTL